MSDPYMGEIRIFGGYYAPLGWAFCDGSLLSIQQYNYLFALLHTNFGGNGTTNFALPDLRARLPVGQGPMPGGQSYALGQQFGTNAVTLTGMNMGVHYHNMTGNNIAANSASGAGALLALPQPAVAGIYAVPGATPTSKLSTDTIGIGGTASPEAHANVMPYLALNYIICLEGNWPTNPDNM